VTADSKIFSPVASRAVKLISAIASFALFLELGFFVAHHGEPAVFLAWERALFDRSPLIAWWLTWSCYAYVLVPIVVILAIVAWRLPQWRRRIVLSVVILIVCWQGADLFQHLFARPRPADWVVKHETAFSYPSSHAAIATGFYGLWASTIYASRLSRPVRIIVPLLLVVFAAAICWSRLVLGAHYITDLVGGALLALAVVYAAQAIVPANRPARH
jgi:membrane-associated phospholipid phosphatase